MATGVLTVQAAREHLAMLSRSAFRAKEQRTGKGVAVLVGHYRGVCLSRIRLQAQNQGQFHCFLQFPQVNFNVSEKDGSKDIAIEKCQIRA